jgi:hypothetical protein
MLWGVDYGHMTTTHAPKPGSREAGAINRQRVIERHRAGMTNRQISRELDFTFEYVRRIVLAFKQSQEQQTEKSA